MLSLILLAVPAGGAELGEATFAGGCFWCMEAPFEKIAGVTEVTVGYTGGAHPDPTYEQVSAGATGHAEAVRIRYDPDRVSYQTLLDVFWRQIDPVDDDGQFADRGSQYRTAIFYHDEDQRRLAISSKDTLQRSGRFLSPISTAIVPAGPFHPAEDYHQDYHRKNPLRYRYYRHGSGRDRRLQQIWDRPDLPPLEKPRRFQMPDDEELRSRLTPLQYRVTRLNATEPPFDNPYWDNEQPGIYVDIISGEPLFASTHKIDSGTGWPSFTRPLEPANITEHEDRTLFMTRTEVKSAGADSHLGHVFDDGPEPTGKRYCINSASLRFIPAADLEKEGLGKYRELFE